MSAILDSANGVPRTGADAAETDSGKGGRGILLGGGAPLRAVPMVVPEVLGGRGVTEQPTAHGEADLLRRAGPVVREGLGETRRPEEGMAGYRQFKVVPRAKLPRWEGNLDGPAKEGMGETRGAVTIVTLIILGGLAAVRPHMGDMGFGVAGVFGRIMASGPRQREVGDKVQTMGRMGSRPRRHNTIQKAEQEGSQEINMNRIQIVHEGIGVMEAMS